MSIAALSRCELTARVCEMLIVQELIASSRFLSARVLALLAVGIVFAALCLRLGHLPLLAPDEGRNAEVGREMKESGAWLVPTYNGVDYLDKPAFYFKAVAFSLAVFGNNETAARMPSAAFGVALVPLVFGFCRKVHGTRCGLLAAIVVAHHAALPFQCAHGDLRHRARLFRLRRDLRRLSGGGSGRQGAAELVSARRGIGGLRDAGQGADRVPDSGAGAVGLQPGRRPARGLEATVRAAEPAGVFRRDAALVCGALPAHRDFLHYGLVEESFKRFTTAKRFTGRNRFTSTC